MKRVAAIAGMVLGLIGNGANADLINFDDLPSAQGLIPSPYSGFNWSNWGALKTIFPASGYTPGTVSPNNTTFNSNGQPASFSSSTSFTVNSLWATAAWRDGLSVTFSGYGLGDSLVYTRTVSPSATEPTLYAFNWTDIYKFEVSTAGGTYHPGYDDNWTQVAIDDITVNVPVPTPATIALLGLGLVGMGAARRKKA